MAAAPECVCVCVCVCVCACVHVCVRVCRMRVPETTIARALCTPQGPVMKCDNSTRAASPLQGPLRTNNCVHLGIKCLALQGQDGN